MGVLLFSLLAEAKTTQLSTSSAEYLDSCSSKRLTQQRVGCRRRPMFRQRHQPPRALPARRFAQHPHVAKVKQLFFVPLLMQVTETSAPLRLTLVRRQSRSDAERRDSPTVSSLLHFLFRFCERDRPGRSTDAFHLLSRKRDGRHCIMEGFQFCMGALCVSLNFYMRMVNGNTSVLRFCFANADGVLGKTRGVAIDDLPADIFALSETHLTSNTMRVIDGSFPQFACYWGAPATKCGVGFLIRKSSVWTASPLTWSINSPCHRHYQTGRLHAISLHVGNGHRELLVYVIYGISGSRWNSHLRRQTHAIIESALADAASRGLPAMIGGDFNLTEANFAAFGMDLLVSACRHARHSYLFQEWYKSYC